MGLGVDAVTFLPDCLGDIYNLVSLGDISSTRFPLGIYLQLGFLGDIYNLVSPRDIYNQVLLEAFKASFSAKNLELAFSAKQLHRMGSDHDAVTFLANACTTQFLFLDPHSELFPPKLNILAKNRGITLNQWWQQQILVLFSCKRDQTGKLQNTH